MAADSDSGVVIADAGADSESDCLNDSNFDHANDDSTFAFELPFILGEMKSAILRLAPELRNYIYELFFSTSGPVNIRVKQPHVQPHAICQVNRQIRAESLSMFYAYSDFESTEAVKMYSFLKALDSKTVSLLRSVRLCRGASISQGEKTLKYFYNHFKKKGLGGNALRYKVYFHHLNQFCHLTLKELPSYRPYSLDQVDGSPPVVVLPDSSAEV